MVRAWRVLKRTYRRQAFDGAGARHLGGRWHSPGTAMVYCSESLALATLEILAHLGDSTAFRSYVAIPVEFPEGCVEILPEDRLPAPWRRYPPPPALQELGDAWVREARSAVMRVPSVLVEVEWNYLLNPAHPDFRRVKQGRARAFRLDQRLRSGPRGGGA